LSNYATIRISCGSTSTENEMQNIKDMWGKRGRPGGEQVAVALASWQGEMQFQVHFHTIMVGLCKTSSISIMQKKITYDG
jgi:hypothetical protein